MRKELQDDCRKFGVRLGLPLSHDAILKTVLHIDEAKWNNAFNYVEQRKWEGRSLKENGHIVTQIPLPNSFTSNAILMTLQTLKGIREFLKDDGSIDFNKLFRESYAAKAKLALRNFYDFTPLIAMSKTNDVAGTAWEPELLAQFPKPDEKPKRSELSKAVADIKDVHNQDLLLLDIALRYHARFNQQEQSVELKEGDVKTNVSDSIYTYFSNMQKVTLGDKNSSRSITVLLRPNDRLRAVFSLIKDSAMELADTLSAQEKASPIDFYDLANKFRRIQAADRRVRMNYLAKITELETLVVEPDGVVSDDTPKEKIPELLYPYYNAKAQYGKMTLEDFTFLIQFRNRVFHKGFHFTSEECRKADKILQCFGIRAD